MTQHAGKYKERVMAAEPTTKRTSEERSTVIALPCGYTIKELQGYRAWRRAWYHIRNGDGPVHCKAHPSRR